MTQAGLEQAYREVGTVVHTLGGRMLGSVDEAESLLTAIMVDAAAGRVPQEPAALLEAAAVRVAGELSARVRARMGPVEGAVEASTQAAAVRAELRRLTLRQQLEALDPVRREVVERVLLHGDSAAELALMTGQDPAALEWELGQGVAGLAGLPGDDAEQREAHAAPTALAAYAMAARGHIVNLDASVGGHVAGCGECAADVSRCDAVIEGVETLRAGGTQVAPRASLWAEIERAIAQGEESPDDAAARVAAAHRRRTIALSAAVVVGLVLAGLIVAVVPALLESRRGDVVAQVVLEDPRTGYDSGTVSVVVENGQASLVVDGPFQEAANSSYVVWLVRPDGVRMALGEVTGGHHVAELDQIGDAGAGAMVEVMREAWDGTQDSDVDVVARGVLG